jgi:hypothetical protein
MEHSASAGAGDSAATAVPVGDRGVAARRLVGPRELHGALAALAACILFVADVMVQRGATPAIGYALVPVLGRVAGGAGSSWA